MTKHVPLFLPLGSIRLLTIFFSFCIIFVHPALADKMAESPNFSILLSPCRKGLIFPTGLFKRDGLYFHSFRYIGAVPLLFLHAEADEEIEGKGPGEVSATVGRHS